MKQGLAILLLTILIYPTGHSQSKQSFSIYTYKKVPGLKLLDTVLKDELINRVIMISTGYGGLILKLDSSMKYRLQGFDCVSSSLIDSGTWKIVKNRLLEISSNKGKKIFDILTFESIYFFIEPIDRAKFLGSLKREVSKYAAIKPFTIDNKIFTPKYVAALHLQTEFFIHEPD